MWSTGKITKWWCRLTVRWWTPESSTSNARQCLLTSGISRGIKPTPSLVPLQQPQRQPVWSAPSLSPYSSALGLHWRMRMGPCQTGEWWEKCFFLPRWQAENCLIIEFQREKRKKRSCSISHHLPIHLKSTEAQTQGKQQFSGGTGSPAFFTAAWCRFLFSLYFSKLLFPLYLFCV